MHLLTDMYCKSNTKFKYLMKGQKKQLQRNPDPDCSIHSAGSFLSPTSKMQMNAKIKSTSDITCVALRDMVVNVIKCEILWGKKVVKSQSQQDL